MPISLDPANGQSSARALGDKFRRHRLARNVTQSDMADQAGISVSALKRIEASGRGSLVDVMSLAVQLGLDQDILDAIPRPPLRSLSDLDSDGRRVDRTRARASRRMTV